MSAEQVKYKRKLFLNRIILHVHSLLTTNFRQIKNYRARLAPRASELGLEEATIYTRLKKRDEKLPRELELHFKNVFRDHFTMRTSPPTQKLLKPMTDNLCFQGSAGQAAREYLSL